METKPKLKRPLKPVPEEGKKPVTKKKKVSKKKKATRRRKKAKAKAVQAPVLLEWTPSYDSFSCIKNDVDEMEDIVREYLVGGESSRHGGILRVMRDQIQKLKRTFETFEEATDINNVV